MKKKLALFMAVLMVSLIVPIESLAISNMGEKDLPAKIAVVTLMDDSDANLDSIGVQPLNYDQATYSYVLNNEADKDTAQLILSLPNEEGSLDISAEGDVEYLELSETITIIRGYLYGDFEVDSTPYIIKAVFTKRVGVDGASAGITIHPKDNVDQSVFFSIGEDLYTDEVIAVDPVFRSARKTNLTPYASPNTRINSAYKNVGSDYANVRGNSLGVTGRAQEVDAYFKPSTSSSAFNVFALLITPQLDSLNSSYKNIVMFRSVNASVESENSHYKFKYFYNTPAGNDVGNNETLYTLLDDGASALGVPFTGTLLSLIKEVFATGYTAEIQTPVNDVAEYSLRVSPSNSIETDFPIVVDFVMDLENANAFRINVNVDMEFTVIHYQNQHQFYIVDSNSVDFRTDAMYGRV